MPEKADITNYRETRVLVEDIATACLMRQSAATASASPAPTRWIEEVVDGVIERIRAYQDEQPGPRLGEDLRVAAALYDAALGVLTSHEAVTARWTVTELGAALHHVLAERLTLAVISAESARFERLRASLREERRRVARELHDRVGHGVYLALRHLDLYERYAAEDPGQAAAKLAGAAEMLDETLTTTRQLATELRRPMPGEDLEYALRAYLDVCASPAVSTHVDFEGDTTRLTPALNEQLYLILREAVMNALRHGRPGRLALRVEVTGTRLRATVTDDGAGFDPAVTAQAGGLAAMRERAGSLRGTLTVLSSAGGGTLVTLEVPLKPAEADAP